MAIGEITPRTGRLQNANPGRGPNSNLIAEALRGLSQSIAGFGSSQGELELENARFDAQAQAYERKLKSTAANGAFDLWVAETQADLSKAYTEVEPGAPNLLRRADEIVTTRQQAFLDGLDVDPQDRESFVNRVKQVGVSARSQAFLKADQENKNYARSTFITSVVQASSRINANPNPAVTDAELLRLSEKLTQNSLSQGEREIMLQEASKALRQAEYLATIRNSNPNLVVKSNPGPDDIAWSQAPPGTRALLTIVGQKESGHEYDVLYGGTKFIDFSDHPRVRVPLGDGRFSTAAGKYGFTADTWDDTVRAMRAQGQYVNDFSPPSQDRAALFLAKQRYADAAKKAGITGAALDLEFILSSGSREEILTAKELLGRTWEGLARMKDDDFIREFSSVSSRGSIAGETLRKDPRYGDLDPALLNAADFQAQQQRDKIEAAQAAQALQGETDFYNQLAIGATVDPNEAYTSFTEAINSGKLTDSTLIARAVKLFDGRFKEQHNAREVTSRLGVDTFSRTDDKQAIHDYLKESKLLEGLQANDERATNTVLRNSQDFGFIPEEIHATMLGKMRSNNVAEQKFALRFYSDAYNNNPGMTTYGLDKEDQADVAAFVSLGSLTSGMENFIALYNQFKDPANEQYRIARMREAKDKTSEITPETFSNNFTSFMERNFFGVKPPDPTLQAKLYSDGILLYENFMGIYGDHNLAMQAASTQLSFSWAPSPGSGRLMKHSPTSPSSGVPKFQDSYDWIDPLVRSTYGFEPEQNYQLHADAQTVSEINSGKPPSYYVQFIDEYGSLQTVFDETGIKRVTVELPEASHKMDNAFTELGNLEYRRQNLLKAGKVEEAKQLEERKTKREATVMGELSNEELTRQLTLFEKQTAPGRGFTPGQVLERYMPQIQSGVNVTISGPEYFRMLREEKARRDELPGNNRDQLKPDGSMYNSQIIVNEAARKKTPIPRERPVPGRADAVSMADDEHKLQVSENAHPLADMALSEAIFKDTKIGGRTMGEARHNIEDYIAAVKKLDPSGAASKRIEELFGRDDPELSGKILIDRKEIAVTAKKAGVPESFAQRYTSQHELIHKGLNDLVVRYVLQDGQNLPELKSKGLNVIINPKDEFERRVGKATHHMLTETLLISGLLRNSGSLEDVKNVMSFVGAFRNPEAAPAFMQIATSLQKGDKAKFSAEDLKAFNILYKALGLTSTYRKVISPQDLFEAMKELETLPGKIGK